MNLIEIRQAGIVDADSLANLFDQYRQFYAQLPNLALAKSFISERLEHQESVIFIAESNSEPIGFCQIYPTFCSVAAARIAVLYDLFVAPSARKTGAGRALMLEATEYAKINRFARLDLSTAKSNTPAQTLYESLGWKRDGWFYQYSLDL